MKRGTERIRTRGIDAARRALGACALAIVLMAGPGSVGSGIAEDTPTPSQTAIRAARELSDAKRFDEAAAKLREARKHDPKNKDVLSLLARVLAWSRHFDESIETYRALLQLYPDDSFDRAGYARTLAWAGRHRESVREFRKAVASNGTDLESRVGYARALSWSGDLAGASKEYLAIVKSDSSYGDAWLGLATVARWRRAATASDLFVSRAEARGADAEGVDEERKAIRLALRPQLGPGWTRSRERQITSDTTAFKLETVGGFLGGRFTLDRSVGLAARVSRLHHWEKNAGGPSSTTLNYDLRSTVLSGDLSFLRFYPIQLEAGAETRRLEQRSPAVLYPLGEEDDFFGFRSRVWGYAGRFTPSLAVHREFIPIKTVDPLTTANVLVPGGMTAGDLSLRWDPNGRANVTGTFSKASYTDDNERTSVSGVAAYRIRPREPILTIDYGLTWMDFTKRSISYFTPLESVRNAAGIALNGYSERAAFDYGARYQFSYQTSSNFDDIAVNMWSGYADVIVGDAFPLGIEGYYSVDNHSYRTWGLTLSGTVRW